MKIRRLSEIDLARIAPLPRDEKIHRLRLLKAGRPPHTYNPMRVNLGDILNLQVFGTTTVSTPWVKIAENIRRQARSEDEAKFNLAVAKALHEDAELRKIISFRKSISPWNVGYGQSVTYWWNLYSVAGGDACFIFADPRLSNPLTRQGMRFVLSMMNERIRVPDPDFAFARLLIVQFPKLDKGMRGTRWFDSSDFELFSSDQLNHMIGETYRLWMDVLHELRREAARATGSTPFGF